MEKVIRDRKYGWLAHTLRSDTISNEALDWNPQAARKPGRKFQKMERAGERSRIWLKTGTDGEILLRPYVPQGIKEEWFQACIILRMLIEILKSLKSFCITMENRRRST
ncbi:hypothetical protein HHI36_014056 [Cryptolaemus montrouzieri]|uniref:Uncharacterized protein n=1 Tax=Cryptolaemus montrouzieri TaxID=559131 RepID=A0ABD2N1L2_9CUCU